jgi:hypothetical protein
VLVGLVGLTLLVGGLATASNMGFKFVPSVAAGKAFNLALPWFNNYTKASGPSGLYTDLHNQDADVQRVSKFTATGAFVDWQAGSPPANNYNVVKGEAYMIFAGAGPIDTAVVVGSHDPNFTFTFTAGQFLNVSAPYHQTFTRANILYADMRSKTSNAIDRISKFTDGAAFVDWQAGSPPANNFTLDLGMGVITHAAATNTGYVWSHY